MSEIKKCNNPEPDVMYSKDEFDNIHIYCENCKKEIVEVKMKGEKKFKWHHAHKITKIKFDD